MIERQELYCHNCGKYVQFDVDVSQNGNLILECPNCGHEHCRVIEDGKITERRWDRRNGTPYPPAGSVVQTIIVTNTSWTNQSTYNNYTSAYIASAANTIAVSGGGGGNATGVGGYGGNTINTAASSVFLYGSWMNTVTT
jgi:hypothetical protein